MRPLLCVCVLLILSLACGKDDPEPSGPDTVPPGTVHDLAATSPAAGQVRLRWTAPGDDGMDGRASQYRIAWSSTLRTTEQWDSAATVAAPPSPGPAGQTETFALTDFPEGDCYFSLKAADENANWSGWSSVARVTVAPPADVAPPAPVANLVVATTTAHSATLMWTAPGDDGTTGTAATYDLRYAEQPITEETWEEAIPVTGLPAPLPAGAIETCAVPGLDTGSSYSFALTTADERANWSGLSNVATTVIADLQAPGRITDLAAVSGTAGTITLVWTAPGNDGAAGRAAHYDLRLSSSIFDERDWESLEPGPDLPAPDSAGTAQSFTVTGLEPEGTYYFAIKAADEASNWSAISNLTGAVAVPFSLRRLTTNPGSGSGANAPTWSPDGSDIAFQAGWDGGLDIYRMPASGGGVVRLTDAAAADFAPAWSPDGGRIAFLSDRGGKNELWILDAASGSGDVLAASDETQMGFGIAWSPDGVRIAFCAGVDEDHFSPTRICTAPAAGGPTEVLLEAEQGVFDPAWSPDGARIAYAAADDGGWTLWSMPADGSGPGIKIYDPPPPWSAASPSWSADGLRIAFACSRLGSSDIWNVAGDGSGARQMTFDPALDYNPAWSPDGRQIAFTSDRTGESEIWILTLE